MGQVGKRTTVQIELRCDCGDAMSGRVSPAVAALKMIQIFRACHKEDGCRVVDLSNAPDQSHLLRATP